MSWIYIYIYHLLQFSSVLIANETHGTTVPEKMTDTSNSCFQLVEGSHMISMTQSPNHKFSFLTWILPLFISDIFPIVLMRLGESYVRTYNPRKLSSITKKQMGQLITTLQKSPQYTSCYQKFINYIMIHLMTWNFNTMEPLISRLHQYV